MYTLRRSLSTSSILMLLWWRVSEGGRRSLTPHEVVNEDFFNKDSEEVSPFHTASCVVRTASLSLFHKFSQRRGEGEGGEGRGEEGRRGEGERGRAEGEGRGERGGGGERGEGREERGEGRDAPTTISMYFPNNNLTYSTIKELSNYLI